MKRHKLKQYLSAGALTLLFLIAIHMLVYLLPGHSNAKHWLSLIPVFEYVFAK